MKKNLKAVLGLSLAAALCAGVVGISAYMTDADTKTNTFTIGEVKIDLQEPTWNPDNATRVIPLHTVDKDPQIENVGINPEYVFMTVSIPYANVLTANADGTKNPVEDTELFNYTVNPGWVEVGTPNKDTTAGTVTHTYAYATGDTMTTLLANDTTPTLFDSVTCANVIEDQGLEVTSKDIILNAYGIQIENINGGLTDPAGVWSVIANQQPAIDSAAGSSHGGAVPVGGIYTASNGAVYNTGNEFPTVDVGDTYSYGDYTYTCTADGWAVNPVADKTKTAYGPILSEINGVAVTSLSGTFEGCTNMITAPDIPSSVIRMFSLRAAPPMGVTNLSRTYKDCTSLTTAPAIPSSVTNMDSTFEGCTSLTGSIVIDSELDTCSNCFSGTTQPITLSGDSSNLRALAVTSPIGNVTLNGVRIVIPEGATYTQGGTTYGVGEVFPEIAVDDTYSYGDYTYTYTSTGWKVNRVADRTKTSYGAIESEINGAPTTSLMDTFSNCKSLTTAPEIPSSVTDMYETFYSCTSLTTAPVIPSSVTDMRYTFHNCKALTAAPEIPDGVSDMSCTFYGCTSLTTAPEIPSSVTSMYYTFAKCTSLTAAPVIPSSVTNMQATFAYCSSMIAAPEIPSSVTNMRGTFSGCTSLTTAPVIPSSVTDMRETFYGCTSLIAAPEVPSSVTNMYYTFKGCTSLTAAPEIPRSVTNMESAFEGCTALTGNIKIHARPGSYDYTNCFKNTVQPIVITGTSTQIADFVSTGNNGNVTAYWAEGIYIAKDGSIYNDGDNLPTLTVGDRYCFQDYQYTYKSDGWWVDRVPDKKKSSYSPIMSEINGAPVISMYQIFYGCTSLTTAPEIPSSVTDVDSAFRGCTSLITAPEIPSSVTDMKRTFQDCAVLTGNVTINANPSATEKCFYNTTQPISLSGTSTKLWVITTTGNNNNVTVYYPEGVYLAVDGSVYNEGDVLPPVSVGDEYRYLDYKYTYSESGWSVKAYTTSFKETYGAILSEINGAPVTNMYDTFSGCTSLTTAPEIPSSVTSMRDTFRDCTSLTAAPDIPSSVTNISGAFYNCTALTTAPVIPSSVTNMAGTFEYCTSLAGDITVNANPAHLGSCFANTTQPITLYGTSTKLNWLARTSGNGNVSVYAGYLGESVSNTGDPYSGVIPEGGVYSTWGDTYEAGSLFPAPHDWDEYTYGDYKFSYANGGWNVEVLDTTKTSYMRIPSEINGEPVTSLSWAFYNCTNMITAPEIPSTVTDMGGTFYGCTSLTGNIVINSSLTEYYNCFYNTTQPITISGSCSDLDALAATANNGNVTIGYDNSVIPSGATYTQSGVAYIAGMRFPTIQVGDVYTSADYTYTYTSTGWTVDTVSDKTKTSYGAIASEINGAPVTGMHQTFKDCKSLTTAPEIPSSVTSMYCTFSYCTSLTTAPVIPSSVTDMQETFRGCTSLTTAPEIPSSVIGMFYTFYGCTSLTGNITINATPWIFTDCFYATVEPIALSGSSSRLSALAATANNGNVTVQQTRMLLALSRTSSVPAEGTYTTSDNETLTEGATIPTATIGDELLLGDYTYVYESTGWRVTPVADKTKTTYGEIQSEINGVLVTSVEGTFSDCTNMTSAPVIPSGVTNMNSTFSGCTSLTGNVVINATPATYSDCFSGTSKPIIILGSAGNAASIASEYSNVSVPDYVVGDYMYTQTGDGWSVKVIDKTKTEYGEILSGIGNIPVISLEETFSGCSNMTVAPKIPSTVTNMGYTFYGCASLTDAPEIPSGVEDMQRAFVGCVLLTDAPEIPDGVTNMLGTFYDCISLTAAPEIPDSVTVMHGTFSGCSSLETAPAIPDGVQSLAFTFDGCSSLVNAPAIPSGVDNLNSTFEGCSSLTTAPEIPSGVTDLRYTFKGCSSLTAAPVIPEGITDLTDTFRNCISLTTAPVIPSSVTNMTGTFSGCSSLTAAPVIPDGVTNMYCTFHYCTALTTAPEIPSSVTNMRATFYNCTSLTAAPVIPSSVTDVQSTFSGCIALTGDVVINSDPTVYLECFNDTTESISLSGNSSKLSEIAATATNNNVTVKE